MWPPLTISDARHCPSECPPETSDNKISADLPGKKRQGKKGKGVKIEKKRRKIVKGKVEN